MKWRNPAFGFIWRLAVCSLVIGGAYLLVFGVHPAHKKLTPKQQVAQLRANLDQVYIATNSLATLKASGPSADPKLTAVRKQVESSLSGLQHRPAAIGSIKNAGATLDNIVAQTTKAKKEFDRRYDVLRNVLLYSPVTDLGKLNLGTSASVVSERAGAAAQGLKNILAKANTTDSSSGLSVSSGSPLSDATAQKLQDEADCFSSLSVQVNAKQLEQANVTRQSCLSAYESLRQSAVHDLELPFQGDYQSYMKATAVPLIRQLDGLLKA